MVSIYYRKLIIKVFKWEIYQRFDVNFKLLYFYYIRIVNPVLKHKMVSCKVSKVKKQIQFLTDAFHTWQKDASNVNGALIRYFGRHQDARAFKFA